MPRGEGNPQLEDGFARIASEILEAIARTPLTDYESRCIHHLWRQTYGWINTKTHQAKKFDEISYGKWAGKTNIARRNVIRTLSRLTGRGIIFKRVKAGSRLIEWGFNKRWKEWVVSTGTPPDAETEAENKAEGVVSAETLVSTQTPPVVATETPKVVATETPTIDKKDIFKRLLRLGADDLLKFLQGLPGWKVDDQADQQWLVDFLADYPEFNLKTAKACRDWWSGKHDAKDQGAWKNRVRNWLDKGRKIAKDSAETESTRQPARRTRSTRPGKVPTAEELKEQERRLGL